MTPEHIFAIVAFSVAAAGTPGPSNALLTATGANVGVVRGLPALVGVVVSMGLMMFIVSFGLATVILDNAALLVGVRWIGAAVLCWFAWQIATSHGSVAGHFGRPVGFFGAAGFQWINPKSWLISASAAATFLSQGDGPIYWQATLIGVLFMLAALPSCLPWLAFGAVLQRVLRSERSMRIFNVGMGVLLAASAVILLI
jgi:threonine/homoserine/homoserine lactone efflux protein